MHTSYNERKKRGSWTPTCLVAALLFTVSTVTGSTIIVFAHDFLNVTCSEQQLLWLTYLHVELSYRGWALYLQRLDSETR